MSRLAGGPEAETVRIVPPPLFTDFRARTTRGQRRRRMMRYYGVRRALETVKTRIWRHDG